MNCDLLIKNGYVVDYATNTEGIYDIAVTGGKITAMEQSLNYTANQTIDAEGKLVVPGLVDMHVHASAWLGGYYGHEMLIKAGVTSALDMSGPGKSVFEIARDHGAGVNLATIEYMRPGHTVKTEDPSTEELTDLISKLLTEGSIGIKLLGGHYPLTPEATSRAIKVAGELNAYTAFHAGTTAHGSNIEGMLEAVELADGYPLHLAHINAYCRGLIKPAMEETQMALTALANNLNISCEAYLSPFNGTSAEIVDGMAGSLVTRRCLKTGGYSEDAAGMEKAILEGWAQINLPQGDEVVLATGAVARDYWKSKDTDVTVSFTVNPITPRVEIATAKGANGKFLVDAISTDGGGIPRNVLIPAGLALVDLGGLTLKEFVAKVSYNPSQILGLVSKGSLAVGKDADITIINTHTKEAYATIVNGTACYLDGKLNKQKGKIITTAAGADYIKNFGLEPLIVNISESSLFTKKARS